MTNVAIRPSALHRIIAVACDLLENGRSLTSQAQLLDRVEAVSKHSAVVGDSDARIGKRYLMDWAETEVAPPSTMLDAQQPWPCSSLAHNEVEPMHVGITTGTSVTNSRRGQRHDDDPSQPHISSARCLNCSRSQWNGLVPMVAARPSPI